MKKRILAAICLVATVFSLAACGKPEETQKKTDYTAKNFIYHCVVPSINQ